MAKSFDQASREMMSMLNRLGPPNKPTARPHSQVYEKNLLESIKRTVSANVFDPEIIDQEYKKLFRLIGTNEGDDPAWIVRNGAQNTDSIVKDNAQYTVLSFPKTMNADTRELWQSVHDLITLDLVNLNKQFDKDVVKKINTLNGIHFPEGLDGTIVDKFTDLQNELMSSGDPLKIESIYKTSDYETLMHSVLELGKSTDTIQNVIEQMKGHVSGITNINPVIPLDVMANVTDLEKTVFHIGQTFSAAPDSPRQVGDILSKEEGWLIENKRWEELSRLQEVNKMLASDEGRLYKEGLQNYSQIAHDRAKIMMAINRPVSEGGKGLNITDLSEATLDTHLEELQDYIIPIQLVNPIAGDNNPNYSAPENSYDLANIMDVEREFVNLGQSLRGLWVEGLKKGKNFAEMYGHFKNFGDRVESGINPGNILFEKGGADMWDKLLAVQFGPKEIFNVDGLGEISGAEYMSYIQEIEDVLSPYREDEREEAVRENVRGRNVLDLATKLSNFINNRSGITGFVLDANKTDNPTTKKIINDLDYSAQVSFQSTDKLSDAKVKDTSDAYGAITKWVNNPNTNNPQEVEIAFDSFIDNIQKEMKYSNVKDLSFNTTRVHQLIHGKADPKWKEKGLPDPSIGKSPVYINKNMTFNMNDLKSYIKNYTSMTDEQKKEKISSWGSLDPRGISREQYMSFLLKSVLERIAENELSETPEWVIKGLPDPKIGTRR